MYVKYILVQKHRIKKKKLNLLTPVLIEALTDTLNKFRYFKNQSQNRNQKKKKSKNKVTSAFIYSTVY